VGLGKTARCFLKNNRSKKVWRHGSCGRQLPSKLTALNSNASIVKKKKIFPDGMVEGGEEPKGMTRE
jgi:hypothetical protein